MSVIDSLTILDIVSVVLFFGVWWGYSLFSEWSRNHYRCLNQLMEDHRHTWYQNMIWRDPRMIDTGIINGLQQGTAFFASTALLIMGGALSMLRYSEDFALMLQELPLVATVNPWLWQIKILGIVSIFGYVFFKLAWAYRLFNYSAIMVGATPVRDHAAKDLQKASAIAEKGAKINVVAARHFTRGMRGYFFGMSYLGWFVHPLLMVICTILVAILLWRRQFHSDALRALL